MPPPMSMTSAILHEIFDDFDFVADLCSAENRDKRARGIGERFAEIVELFFHEQTGRGLVHETRDADNGSVGAVGGAKSVANEEAIAEGGELLRECFVVLLFFVMKTDVFEKKYVAVSERLTFRHRDRADAIGSKANVLDPVSVFELFDDGEKRKLGGRDLPWAGQDAKRGSGERLFEWPRAMWGAFRECAYRR